MRLPAFVLAFLDGFSLGGLFGRTRRPSAPDHFFAQDEDDELDDPLSGAEQPLHS